MITDHYVTKSQAARLLGVNSLTIWRWIRAGKLPAEKVGREVLIRRDDLTGLTKSQRGRKPKWSKREATN